MWGPCFHCSHPHTITGPTWFSAYQIEDNNWNIFLYVNCCTGCHFWWCLWDGIMHESELPVWETHQCKSTLFTYHEVTFPDKDMCIKHQDCRNVSIACLDSVIMCPLHDRSQLIAHFLQTTHMLPTYCPHVQQCQGKGRMHLGPSECKGRGGLENLYLLSHVLAQYRKF